MYWWSILFYAALVLKKKAFKMLEKGWKAFRWFIELTIWMPPDFGGECMKVAQPGSV